MSHVNQLILGDNLEVLKRLPSESVDLIYLDPPFFSNRTYEVIWGDEGERRSFEDRFSGGIEHYIGWLRERVEEMYRLLKPTGSFFLHCDWHANAEIKAFILNRIFGEDNFRTEIIWRRSNAHNDAKQGRRGLGNISDTIWYFSKSEKYTFNQLYTEYTQDYINDFYKYTDKDGRKYRLGDLTGPGGASKGNPKYEVMGVTRYWRYSKEKMNELIEEGRIIQTKPGTVPQYKRYLDEMPGVALQNIWDDIKPLQSQSNERMGYPTQKPEALLNRIIKMASDEGDIVLDPFVGGGTTVAVADRLSRNWIGIDQSVSAVKVTDMRLQQLQTSGMQVKGAKQAGFEFFAPPYVVQLHKYDYDTLRFKDAFKFETFIVQQLNGISNTKQRGDLGIDGRTAEGVPIQVKRSENVGRNVIDNFLSAAKRFDKALFDRNVENKTPVGFIVAFSFVKGAVQEVARLKLAENVVIKLVTVEEIVPISKKPTLRLEFLDKGDGDDLAKVKGSLWDGLRVIEFTAKAQSEHGIEFYAWDFNYKEATGFNPEIYIDRVGVQTRKFRPGLHRIAVKVIDNEGLENVEVVTLKMNGKIEAI